MKNKFLNEVEIVMYQAGNTPHMQENSKMFVPVVNTEYQISS